VPNVFGTVSELLFEVLLHVGLEFCAVGEVHAVPELGLAQVEVVDGVEVKVLLMPAEHGLPGAHVDVGRCDSFQLGPVQAIATGYGGLT
jgi:hypothetical protein